MIALGTVIIHVIELFVITIVAQSILSWVIVAGFRNQFTIGLYTNLGRATDPIIQPIRRIMPSFGMIDITPMIVILVLVLVREVIYSAIASA